MSVWTHECIVSSTNLFQHVLSRCRKVINVDPTANPGDNTTRTELRTSEYAQVVLFDHFSRRAQ